MDPSARDVVRQRVTEGLSRRRARRAVRELARIAPWVAAVALMTTALARLLGWPMVTTWAGLALVAAGLGAWFLWRRRAPAATDLMAASLDADAGLRGELRSAFWFSEQREADPWASFHVERAAERLTVLQWSDFYPPVRATRAWVVTAVLIALAAIVTVRLPARRAVVSVKPGAAVDTADLPLEAILPPDVRRRLEDLLKQIEAGKMKAAEANAKMKDLEDLLSKLDPSLDPKLAELAKRAQEAAAADPKGDKRSLADRAKAAAAEAGLPEDMREQLKELADKLSNPRVGERQGESQNASASSDAGQLGKASEGAQANEASAAQAAMQLSREAASDPSGQMMLAGAGSMGGDSRAGAGGNSGAKPGNINASQIAQALRQELIEASADTLGQNVANEDIRRKTEQSKSALGFTHVVAPPAVDPSRTLPPPPVPDARKPLVLQYFIRR
ncbi:MAG TPA: hypothetical protein VJN96_13065 [Vicinamibacterales bacterium]|nr:hypothetical protein [Vicinamibacterales bacterium]